MQRFYIEVNPLPDFRIAFLNKFYMYKNCDLVGEFKSFRISLLLPADSACLDQCSDSKINNSYMHRRWTACDFLSAKKRKFTSSPSVLNKLHISHLRDHYDVCM